MPPSRGGLHQVVPTALAFVTFPAGNFTREQTRDHKGVPHGSPMSQYRRQLALSRSQPTGESGLVTGEVWSTC